MREIRIFREWNESKESREGKLEIHVTDRSDSPSLRVVYFEGLVLSFKKGENGYSLVGKGYAEKQQLVDSKIKIEKSEESFIKEILEIVDRYFPYNPPQLQLSLF